MVNIIMHGCGGKMGHVVADLVKNDPDCQIVAGIDPAVPALDFPVFASPAECTVDADVIIDFSTATAVPALLDFAKEKHIPVVVCTTALSDETQAKLEETAKSVAVLKSANMSIGVNLLLDLVQRAAQILYDANFDIEVVEKHHNQKIDAPSGTAMALADAINTAMDEKFHYVYDRPRNVKNGNAQKSASMLSAAAISLGNMMSSSQGVTKSSPSAIMLPAEKYLLLVL